MSKEIEEATKRYKGEIKKSYLYYNTSTHKLFLLSKPIKHTQNVDWLIKMDYRVEGK